MADTARPLVGFVAISRQAGGRRHIVRARRTPVSPSALGQDPTEQARKPQRPAATACWAQHSLSLRSQQQLSLHRPGTALRACESAASGAGGGENHRRRLRLFSFATERIAQTAAGSARDRRGTAL
ncbi:unnamed protein product [Lampetra planeri]